LKFHNYLKKCRETYDFTQEELTSKLQSYHTLFETLDISTLSRWERGVTHPSVEKKLNIIKLFEEYSDSIFPCFESEDFEETIESVCEKTIDNIIGKNKELVLNFPSQYIKVDEFKVTQLRDIENIENIIELSVSLDQELTKHFSLLQDEHFKEWASHPSSFFLISQYKEQFFGLLFVLKLKPSIFKKVMNFEIQEKDISVEDFADVDEEGSHYLLNFYSHAPKSAAILFMYYYRYLIKHQKNILELGAAVVIDDGDKLLKRLNLQHYKDVKDSKHTISYYRAQLRNVLMNETVIKTIF